MNLLNAIFGSTTATAGVRDATPVVQGTAQTVGWAGVFMMIGKGAAAIAGMAATAACAAHPEAAAAVTGIYGVGCGDLATNLATSILGALGQALQNPLVATGAAVAFPKLVKNAIAEPAPALSAPPTA